VRWITRENVKVDRVACPWLITRFVDPIAEFLFVPESELLARATSEGATPFDATRFSEVRLNHRGDRCTFEAILEDYNLTDPALQRLGEIVRSADVKGQEHIVPEGLGLRAIAEGFAAPVSRSTACSALCAKCVRPSFIFAILASGSCGWVQSSFDPFFFRFRSTRARSARVGVSMPEAWASFVKKSR
jgi:hypothetical protein